MIPPMMRMLPILIVCAAASPARANAAPQEPCRDAPAAESGANARDETDLDLSFQGNNAAMNASGESYTSNDSCFPSSRIASRIASLTWSHSLSGCEGLTFSNMFFSILS